MQHGEGVEGRLGDSVFGDQAEATVERGLDYALLFEDVGEGPVTHSLGEAVALTDGAGEPWSHVDAVGDVGFVGVAGVVFAEDERHFGKRRGGDLVVDLCDRAADHAVAGDLFVGAEDVFGGVVRVDVGGNEVDRDIVLLAVLEEGGDPGGLRGGWASDGDPGAYFFDGADGVVVELEVSWLRGFAGPEVEVRFVPDFEAPFGDLVDAVVVDKVLSEGSDHGVP